MRLRLTVCPCYNEKVTITTEAISYNKIFCYRNFTSQMKLVSKLCSLRLHFALMDYETRKVAEVPDEVVAPMGLIRQKLLRGPRYKALENPIETLYRVRYFDLDMNGHVNNSKYLEWMLMFSIWIFDQVHTIPYWTSSMLRKFIMGQRFIQATSLTKKV